MKNRIRIAFILAVIAFLAACQPSAQTAAPAASDTAAPPASTFTPGPTLTPTFTPEPTETLFPTLTALPSVTPSPTPPTYVREGSTIPVPDEPITAENADQIVELARLGKGAIQQVVLSENGLFLLVYTTIGIYGYNADTLEEVWGWEDPAGIATMAVPKLDRWIAAATNDGRIALLIYQRGSMFSQIISGYEHITGLAFSSDGDRLAAIGDKGVTIWPVGETEPLYEYSEMTGDYIHFSPEGDIFYAKIADQLAMVEVQSGEILKKYDNKYDESEILFSNNGQYFSYGFFVWDAQTGEKLFSLLDETQKSESPGAFYGISAFSADSNYIAANLYRNQYINIWRISDGKLMGTLNPPSVSTWCSPAPYYTQLALSPDFNRLVASTDCNMLEIWDIENWKFQELTQVEGQFLNYPTNSQLIIYGDSVLQKIDPRNGINIQILDHFSFQRIPNMWVIDQFSESKVLFSADGNYLFAENNIWHLPTGEHLPKLDNEAVLAASPENDYIYTFDNANDIVYTRSIGDFKIVNQVNLLIPEREMDDFSNADQDYFITDLEISPNGANFSGHIYKSDIVNFYTWDLTDGHEIEELFADCWRGYYNPTGEYLVTNRSDGLYIANAKTKSIVFILEKEYSDFEKNIFFSPDSSYLFVIKDEIDKYKFSENGSIELIDSFPFELDGLYILDGLAISPNNEIYIIASENNLTIYNFNTGELLATISAHLDEIASIAFSPDGKYLATSSYDGTVRIWGIPPNE